MCNGNGVDLKKKLIEDPITAVGKGVSDAGKVVVDGIHYVTGDKARSMERKAERAQKKQQEKLQVARDEAEVKRKAEYDRFLTTFKGRSNTRLGGATGGDENLFTKRLLGE